MVSAKKERDLYLCCYKKEQTCPKMFVSLKGSVGILTGQCLPLTPRQSVLTAESNSLSGYACTQEQK